MAAPSLRARPARAVIPVRPRRTTTMAESEMVGLVEIAKVPGTAAMAVSTAHACLASRPSATLRTSTLRPVTPKTSRHASITTGATLSSSPSPIVLTRPMPTRARPRPERLKRASSRKWVTAPNSLRQLPCSWPPSCPALGPPAGIPAFSKPPDLARGARALHAPPSSTPSSAIRMPSSIDGAARIATRTAAKPRASTNAKPTRQPHKRRSPSTALA